MIPKEEVEHIAKLARLELTDKEVKKMQKDLSEILDYFDLLKNAPEPEKNIKEKDKEEIETYLRKDEAGKRDARNVEKIIASFPDKKEDYIKVKSIL